MIIKDRVITKGDPAETDQKAVHPETMLTDEAKIEGIVKKYDAESNFRALGGLTSFLVIILCVALSLFHHD